MIQNKLISRKTIVVHAIGLNDFDGSLMFESN